MLRHEFSQQDFVKIHKEHEENELQNTEKLKTENPSSGHQDIDKNGRELCHKDDGFFTRLWNRLFEKTTASEREKNDAALPHRVCVKSEESSCERWLHFFHSFSLLHHMPIPVPNKLSKPVVNKKTKTSSSDKNDIQDSNHHSYIVRKIEDDTKADEKYRRASQHAERKPTIAAISHSSPTSDFYQKRGFPQVVEFVYNANPEIENR